MSSSARPGPLVLVVGTVALSGAGCLIDRSPLPLGSGIDALVRPDAGPPSDAGRDARIGPDSALDAFADLDAGADAFVPLDAGMDAATDAFSPFDAPQPDAFVLADAFVPRDAFTPLDAFAPDAFVPPDAYRAPDAFVPSDAFVVPDAFLIPDAFVLPDAYRVPDAYVGPDAYSFGDLVAWWPFSSTTDMTGHGHDLDNAGVEFADPIATFDNNDNLNTPDADDLDEIRTVAFWVRSGDTGRNMGLVCRNPTWGVAFTSGLMLNCNFGGAARLSAAVPSGTWTHVACSSDGANTTLYVGGTAIGRGSALGSPAGTTGITIGEPCTIAGANDELRGSITDVRLYRRALTDGEVGGLASMRPPP